MGAVQKFGDGLRNLIAQLGTSRDKAFHTFYNGSTISDLELVNAYRVAWLPRKIVEAPARDAMRNWREWQAEAEDKDKIEKLERRLNVRGKVLDAKIKANLFGGAAIYIATNNKNVAEPLGDKEEIESLTVLTRLQLTVKTIDDDPLSMTFNEPLTFILANSAVEIHASRLIRFIGKPFPDPNDSSASGVNYGWGDSVLLSVFEAVRNADSTGANITSLIFESKVDVIKIPGFMASLTDPEYETQVLNRLQLAARAKGINGSLILDAEEEYEQKSASFSGLKDWWLTALQVCSGASDIPMTRLLGQSPGGMNATGDSDMQNYYDMVSAIQELDIQPPMAEFDRLLVQNALGKEDDDIIYVWAPLWQPTTKERADIGKTISDTVKTLSDTNLFPDDVLGKASTEALANAGILPGIDAAEEFGSEEPDAEELLKSIQQPPQLQPPVEPVTDASLKDMAPRPLYVRRDVVNKQDILDWAESQGILVDEDPLHVTITHSSHPVDWMKMGTTYSDHPLGYHRIRPGGPRSVEVLGDQRAVVLEFQDNELAWRHDSMVEKGATWDFPKYMPHITLTYSAVDLTDVEPYRGPIILGPEIFEDVK